MADPDCLKDSSTSTDKARDLPKGFKPGEYDVICSRGSEPFNHVGNKRLRRMIDKHLSKYGGAKSKLEKSMIVAAVVDTVKDMGNFGEGLFIRQDKTTKRWHEVSDKLAREKVGQAFRAEMRKLNSSKSPPDRRNASGEEQESSSTNASDPSFPTARTGAQNVGLRHVPLALSPGQEESRVGLAQNREASILFTQQARQAQLHRIGPQTLINPQSTLETLRRESNLMLAASNLLPRPLSAPTAGVGLTQEPMDPVVYARLYQNLMAARSARAQSDRAALDSLLLRRSEGELVAARALQQPPPLVGSLASPPVASLPRSSHIGETGASTSTRSPAQASHLDLLFQSETAGPQSLSELERLRRFRR